MTSGKWVTLSIGGFWRGKWCYWLNCVPLKIYVGALTSVPVNITLLGNRIFTDRIKLREDHNGLRWTWNQYDWCLFKKRRRNRCERRVSCDDMKQRQQQKCSLLSAAHASKNTWKSRSHIWNRLLFPTGTRIVSQPPNRHCHHEHHLLFFTTSTDFSLQRLEVTKAWRQRFYYPLFCRSSSS